MTPPTSPVDKSTLVGSVHASEQEIHLDGVVTHTRSRALRAPFWALLLAGQALGGDELLAELVRSFLS